jgi:hypothetical protein
MEQGGFEVIPDQVDEPCAVFAELEAAMAWGLARYGSDGFRIRWVSLALEPEAARADRPRNRA